MSRLVDAVVEQAGLRPDAVEGADLVFGTGAVRHVLSLGLDKHDRFAFGWTVRALDTELSPVLAGFGGIGVEIWRPDRSPLGGYSYPVPAARQPLDAATLADLVEYAPAAVGFVQDRADLGGILLADGDVHRGPVWAALPPNTAAARLAKAVILARSAGDGPLEEQALRMLAEQGDRDITWVPGEPYLFRDAVGDWARKYAKVVGVDLSDLTRKRRRR
ncbi:MAG: hypothetical protein HOV79_06420 [Hamadaea sp.]|nr:hypothetical protein [Hamadaea sp.]